MHCIHLDRLLHLDLQFGIAGVCEHEFGVCVANQDLALLARGALDKGRDLLVVVPHRASVGLAENVSANKGS